MTTIGARIKFVDVGADLQAAIDALGTAGGIIQLAAGTYSLTSTLTFPTDRPVRLLGAGRGLTILDWIGMGGTPNNHLIKVQYSDSGIEDLTIKGPAVAGTGVGIRVGYTGAVVRDCRFRNVLVYNTAGEAISFLGTAELGAGVFTFLNMVEDCSFRLNYQAGATSGGMCYIGAGCTTIRFLHCSFDSFKGTALSDFTGVAGSGVALEHCSFDNPADNAGHWVQLSRSLSPKLIGCRFENTTANASKYKIWIGNGCIGASIRDCELYCIESTPLWIASAQGGSGTQVEYGTSIINNWIRINAATPTGATIMVFGSANETPVSHVVAGGGIIRADTLARVAWSATYITETAGTLVYRATS